MPATRCAAWVLEADEGAEFRHLATDGSTVVAIAGGGVTAFAVDSGQSRWRWVNPAGSPPSSVAVIGDRVVVILEADHRIVALEAESGVVVWSAALEERGQAWIAADAGTDELGTGWLAVREPTRLTMLELADGDVGFVTSVPAGSSPPVIVGSAVVVAGEQQLGAWDATTGEWLWKSALEVAASVPLVGISDVVVAATADGEVVAVDATGSERWRHRVPGVQWLLALDGETVAAVSSTSMQALSVATGEVEARVAVGPLVHDVAPAGPGELLVVTGANVQRIDAGLAGETWTLWAVIDRGGARPVHANAGWSQYVVASLDAGRILAAFEVPFTTDERRRDPHCPDARPSEAFGSGSAWQSGPAHVRLDYDRGRLLTGVQLWIGMLAADPRSGLTVSARELGGTARAQLQSDDDEWTDEVTLTGGRTSTGWPTHWVTRASFPRPGCWAVTVSHGDESETVVIAVPPAAADPPSPTAD